MQNVPICRIGFYLFSGWIVFFSGFGWGDIRLLGGERQDGVFDMSRDYNGQLAIFPGAQGYGTNTPAGRGGRVIRVTSLAEEGSGTLREALEAKGPRLVVFEAGGVIELMDNITISNPYLTVAGQTAPPPGITLIGGGLQISTHDVLIQHIRIRPGDRPGRLLPEHRSAISVNEKGRLGPDLPISQIVIDHCSLSWSIDKNLSLWDENTCDITVRNCILSEGLAFSTHWKGEHSKGLLIGDQTRRVSVIGNLFAHNTERNPYAKGGSSSLIVNNLIYNPGYRAIHITDYSRSGAYWAAILGNVMISGIDTPPNLPLVWEMRPAPAGSQVVLDDNLIFRSNGELAEVMANVSQGGPKMSFDLSPLTIRPANQVKEWVLRTAGARPAQRDEIDLRIVRDVREGTGRIINSQKDVGGYPSYNSTYRTIDLPADSNGDEDGDGYTNLEEWLQEAARGVEGD